MTPQTPPTGAAGDVGKTLPRPSGRRAHVRTVIDTTPTVGVHACFEVIGDRLLCFRCRGHVGGHLPLPRRWPSMDVTRDNPRYVRSTT